MKKRMYLLLTLLLSATVLAACGAENGNDNGRGRIEDDEDDEKDDEEKPEDEDGEDPDEGEIEINEPQYDAEAEGAIVVSDVESFLLAIAPGADILLEPGTYNLSDYMEEMNDVLPNDYAEVIDWIDGRELHINGVEGLRIRGRAGETTEIVIDPRSAEVIDFNECSDISLENLVIGHTEQAGTCEGSVLSFYECRNIDMSGMELYGCGTYGIDATRVYGIHTHDSVIRDCTAGAIAVASCSGVTFDGCSFYDIRGWNLILSYDANIGFWDCSFDNNGSTGMVYNNDGITSFYGCSFGAAESEMLDCEALVSSTIVYDPECSFTQTMTRQPVVVSDIEELVEAIQPDAMIFIEPGSYNLSDYLMEIPSIVEWNDAHDYVKIRDCYDGPELVVKDVNTLSISGYSVDRADTEILTDPRYATVINYEDCSDIMMQNLTIGHTERGECVGDVIAYRNHTIGAYLGNMDIFGCGVYGIVAENFNDNLYCYDSIIHDCFHGPLYLENSPMVLNMVTTQLVDSLSGGFFPDNDEMYLYFYDCKFGDKETENFLFRDNIHFTDCEWGEVQVYPDYSESEEVQILQDFTTDGLSVVSFDAGVLRGSRWGAFLLEDNGDTTPIDRTISFYDDNTGIEVGYDEIMEFSWECDSAYSAVIYDESGEEVASVVLYSDRAEGNSSLWMQVISGGIGSWYYPIYE